MSGNANICAVCKVPATQICAGCKNVYYCNREHQKKHWKEGHKNNCSCYKIAVTDKLGHHLVASRDIRQNEVILKENPLLIGPAKSTAITCLACNRRIRQKPGDEYRCKNCFWPLCGKKCQESAAHKNECKVMKDKLQKDQTDSNTLEKNKSMLAIAPLRCILLKSSSPSKYDVLRSLPPPNASTQQQEQIKTVVVPFINDVLKLDIPEQEIIDVATIFDLYSLEVIKEEGSVSGRGLFPVSALLKHNCKPNTKHSFHGDGNQLMLIATVPIAKGDIITTSYAEILWGTLTRRAHLLETKNINCECTRCADNTEFGTYLSAIFCARCKKTNEIVCPKILSTDSLNPAAVWKCEKCDHTIRGRQMVWGNEAIKSEISRIDKRIPLNLEQFLVKYKETLHPKNYHALVVKYALTQMYGNNEGYLYNDLTDEILERKLEICHELLEVIDELDPGFTKLRGSVLYELQATMVVQTKREFNKGNITKAAAQESMMECLTILKEATQILSSEPDMKEFLKEQLEKFCKELDFDD